MKPKLSVYERIMRASRNGRGMRLSPADVRKLSCDDAIVQVADQLAWEREQGCEREEPAEDED